MQVLPEDLLKFGLIPEFVGRLPVIGAVRSLDEEALVRILVEPKNALVKQFHRVFELDNVELELTEDALEAVAEQALLRGTGARGLRAILEEVLLEVMYDLPSREDIGRCVVDKSVVLQRVAPSLVPRGTGQEKSERSAPRGLLTAAGSPPALLRRASVRSRRRLSVASRRHCSRCRAPGLPLSARRSPGWTGTSISRRSSRAGPGASGLPSLERITRARRGARRPADRLPDRPRHRDERQGLDLAHGGGDPAGLRAVGRHLLEPAPRADQRAARVRRRRDLRRRSRRRFSGPLAELERFLGLRATWFELVTAAAYAWFADRRPRPPSSRWASAAATTPRTSPTRTWPSSRTSSSITPTSSARPRESIAAEKAGIVKAGLAPRARRARSRSSSAIFEAEAERAGARAIWRRGEEFGCESNRLAVGGRVVDLWTPLGRFSDVLLPLHGAHQADNAACAVAAAQAFLGTPLDAGSGQPSAFASVTVPGRLEVVRRHLSSCSTAPTIPPVQPPPAERSREDFAAARRVVVVMGCLRGRDPRRAALGARSRPHRRGRGLPSPLAPGPGAGEASRLRRDRSVSWRRSPGRPPRRWTGRSSLRTGTISCS